MANNVIIELKNVSKHFGQTYAVEDFNLYVKKGEFVTFLGVKAIRTAGSTADWRLAALLIELKAQFYKLVTL